MLVGYRGDDICLTAFATKTQKHFLVIPGEHPAHEARKDLAMVALVAEGCAAAMFAIGKG